MPSGARTPGRTSNWPEDLLGLGATIHQVCTSWLMHRDDRESDDGLRDPASRPPLGRLRKGVPPVVRRLVTELMASDPGRRPSAAAAAEALSPYAVRSLQVPAPTDSQSPTARRVRERIWRQAYELLTDDRLPAEPAASSPRSKMAGSTMSAPKMAPQLPATGTASRAAPSD
jgi:hypothetical protein